jgi:hypothetical protein
VRLGRAFERVHPSDHDSELSLHYSWLGSEE